MGQLLNFVLGISAIFLFVSLFVATVQELIARILALRARYLRVGIVKLLEKGKSDIGILGARSIAAPLVDRFYQHPLVEALGSSRLGGMSAPSYVSRETFTSVALQITDMAGSDKTAEQLLAFARKLKDKPDSTPLEQAIAIFAEETGGDLQKLQTRLGAWFDESMERVGGAYKRWTQTATIVIGIAFAAALNIDSIVIGQWLLVSSEQAAAFADMVSKLPSGFSVDPELREALLKAMEDGKVPFGWQHISGVSFFSPIGWVATGLAASLGSAFWFDTLNRFVSIRATGTNPDEKKGADT